MDKILDVRYDLCDFKEGTSNLDTMVVYVKGVKDKEEKLAVCYFSASATQSSSETISGACKTYEN